MNTLHIDISEFYGYNEPWTHARLTKNAFGVRQPQPLLEELRIQCYFGWYRFINNPDFRFVRVVNITERKGLAIIGIIRDMQ